MNNYNVKPNLNCEIASYKKNKHSFLIGIDEVGRGSWAGPIVACSCWINPKYFNELPKNINDSKKLSENQRDEIYKKTTQYSLRGISISTNHEIEKYGLILSNFLAVKRSLFSLLKCIYYNFQINLNTEFKILIDGNLTPNFNLLKNIKKLDD